jgi:antitoxin component YwqK of YwqJK toxin-antitoxin module
MRVNERDLDHDYDDFVTYQGQPFTGEGVENYSDGTLAVLNTYVEGIQHGVQQEWFRTGDLKSDAVFKNGQPSGTYKRWHDNGQLAVEIEFSESGYPRHRKSWDSAGNLLTDYIDRTGDGQPPG